ncbi:MAG: S16 family serine protease [Desulfococcaceae bacterium]
MTETGLAEVVWLAGRKSFKPLRARLSTRLSGAWFAGAPGPLGRDYQKARTALAETPDLGDLLDRHLLLALLAGDSPTPSWAGAWANAHLPIRSILAPLDFRAAVAGRWRAVPLLVAGENGARVRRLVVGVAPLPRSEPRSELGAGSRPEPRPEVRPDAPWPPWAESLLDEDARAAIRNAVEAAGQIVSVPPGFHPWFLPLAAPEGPERITGPSLGLPAALGLLAAIADSPLPRRLVVTGNLRPNGTVARVGRMAEKFQAAEKDGFRVLLHPPEDGWERNGRPAAVPVPTLARAWLLADLFTPGRSGELALLSGMLDDPDRFVANVDGLPPEWLDRVRENGDHRAFLAALGDRPERFAAFADRLESAVYANHTRLADAMAALMDEPTLARLAETAPLAAFRWCTAGLSLCNHTGRVPEAREWIRRGEALLPRARRADLDRVVDYFNHRLVARHNRYRFSPELPPDLSELLALLTEQYRIQCAADCPTEMVLGRAWGTIAQNCAFCGPEHLDRTRELIARARRALGEDTVPEHREEWLRQSNYLTYALLDGGPDFFEEARVALFEYLEIDGWSELWPRFSGMSRWRRALIARFLAEAGGDAERAAFLAAVETGGSAARPAFPWPLWCFNTGRVARSRGGDDAAQSWFVRSVALCRAPEVGPSVRVMALLPLAALWEMGRPPADFQSLWEEIQRAAEALDPDHFRRLKTGPPEAVLAEVSGTPGRLFPFIYR